MIRKQYSDIDAYIVSFPKSMHSVLEELRQTIKKAAPKTTEAISYQMPTFKLDGKNLVHFAAFKNHIGFYPTPSGITNFKKELSGYEQSKGAIRFPIDEPLPLGLIKKIVAYRVKEVSAI